MKLANALTSSRLAALIGAMALVATTIPFTNAAENDPGNTDGLVAVIEPQNAVLSEDGTLAMNAVGNAYEMTYALFDGAGDPFLVRELDIDIHTLDGRVAPEDAGTFEATLIKNVRITSPDAFSTGTIRLSASEVTFHTANYPDGREMPFGGISVTIVAYLDGAGASLGDADGLFPTASFSTAANEAAAAGEWELADQLGEGLEPIFLLGGQPAGLIDPGNPFYNPGLEVGGSELASDDCPECPSTSIVGWFFLKDAAATQSTSYLVGQAGHSGNAVKVAYKAVDFNEKISFGQFLGVPGSPLGLVWKGSPTEDVTVSLQARWFGAMIPASTGYEAIGTLHVEPLTGTCPTGWLQTGPAGAATDCYRTAWPVGYPGGIPADAQWRRVTYNFGDLEGWTITSFFVSLYRASSQDASFYFDSFAMDGAVVSDVGSLKSDLSDGFSMFIEAESATMTDANEVVQKLTLLANGEAYLYKVSGMDYRDLSAKEIDLPAAGSTVFQLLDQNFLASAGSHDEGAVLYHTVSSDADTTLFRYYENGQIADDYLALVPKAGIAGKTAVPWVWSDVVPGAADSYTTFGQDQQPSSGFFSPVRNSFKAFTTADHMDYVATPVRFDSGVGSTLAYASDVTLTCPIQTPTVACNSDPDPDLLVTFESDSPIVEMVTLELVAWNNTVLGSAQVSAQGGSHLFTLTAAQMADLASSGEVRVFARALDSTFVNGDATPLFELDNLLPTAIISHAAIAPASTYKGTSLQFTSSSTDPEGEITAYAWKVVFEGDASPDGDADAVGAILRTGTAPSFTYAVADDGAFMVELTITDSGGAQSTDRAFFNATNRAPVATISGDLIARPNVAKTYAFSGFDQDDGIVSSVSYDDGSGVWRETALTAVAITFPAEGTYVIGANATDFDGANSTTATRTVLVDGTAPTNALSVPAAPASGWHTANVPVSLTRADTGGSGVVSTIVTITRGTNVQTLSFPGSAPATFSITNDGTSVITAVTTDAAGNVATVATTTVKLDKGNPTATITGPDDMPAGPISGVFASGTDVTVTVNAQAVSGITKVEFFLDGATPIAVDTDGSNGWSWTWEASGAGLHEIVARATSTTGKTVYSEPIVVLVV